MKAIVNYSTESGFEARKSVHLETELGFDQIREMAAMHVNSYTYTYTIIWDDGKTEDHAASCPGRNCMCALGNPQSFK